MASDSTAIQTATLPILRYYDGDDAAFAAIDREWRRRLIHFLLSMGARPQDAEDLVQEAFFRIVRGRFHPEHRFDPSKGRFDAFVFRIVRNLYFDQVRCEIRRPEMTSLDADAEDGHKAAEPSVPACQVDALITAEGAVQLRSLLAQLPDSQRLVVLLRDFEELPFHEIAEILEEPLGTVVSQRRLGLNRIRVLWTTYGVRSQ